MKTVTFPDNFSTELETVISQLVGLAADPEVKVVVAGQAIGGSIAAARKDPRAAARRADRVHVARTRTPTSRSRSPISPASPTSWRAA